jgi:hypothetical protein
MQYYMRADAELTGLFPDPNDACLYDSTSAHNASIDSTGAGEALADGVWWIDSSSTDDTIEEWVWKDVGKSVTLSGIAFKACGLLGVKLQYWDGTASPTSGELDGDTDWVDVTFTDVPKAIGTDYYFAGGIGTNRKTLHKYKFLGAVRNRYWKFHFLFDNRVLYHEPYYVLARHPAGDMDNETKGNTYISLDRQLPNGMRWAGFVTPFYGDSYETSDITMKMCKRLDTYDWFVTDVDVVSATQCKYESFTNAQGAVEEYFHWLFDTPKLVPDDDEDYFIGFYVASGSGEWYTKHKSSGGSRQVRLGDISGESLSWSPDTSYFNAGLLYRPTLKIESLRGISSFGASVDFVDTGSTNIDVCLTNELRNMYEMDYPVEDDLSSELNHYVQANMDVRNYWNSIGLGVADTGDSTTGENYCAEIADSTSFTKPELFEIDIDVAVSSLFDDAILSIGLHKFDNTSPNRATEGYRNREGIYLRWKQNGVFELETADGSTSTITTPEVPTGIEERTIRTGSAVQNFSNVIIRYDFTRRIGVLLVNGVCYGAFEWTTTIDAALSSNLGWSISISGGDNISVNGDNSIYLIKKLLVKTNDSGYYIYGKSDRQVAIDSTDYSVVASTLRFSADPKYARAPHSLDGFNVGCSFHFDGVTVDDFISRPTESGLATIDANSQYDQYVSIELAEPKTVGSIILAALEEGKTPRKIETWMYSGKSTDIYWSDARDWDNVDWRYGANSYGQWGYITVFDRLDEPAWHTGFLDYHGVIDTEFMYPFYKWSADHDYETEGILHGWSWVDEYGTGTIYAAESKSEGYAIIQADRRDAGDSPRGIFFSMTKPNFANGEALTLAFTSAVEDQGSYEAYGTGLQIYDANNVNKSVMFRSVHNVSSGWPGYYNARAYAVRSYGDTDATGYNTSSYMKKPHNMWESGGTIPVIRGSDTIAIDWYDTNDATLYNWEDNSWEYIAEPYNAWNALSLLGTDLKVGLAASRHATRCLAVSIIRNVGVPTAWPLTEFRNFNSKKSIGIAGCWNPNNKQFEFQFSDLESGGYYLWAYIGGASDSISAGEFSVDGQPGSYPITSGAASGEWVQIGSSLFTLTNLSTIIYEPSTGTKDDFNNTVAILGVCAKKTSGAPSTNWTPRGYLSSAERYRAAFDDPNVAKISEVEHSTQDIQDVTKIVPEAARSAELIEIAFRLDRSSTPKVHTHEFDYKHNFINSNGRNNIYRGLYLRDNRDQWVCQANNGRLEISGRSMEGANVAHKGLCTVPFKLGTGFYVEFITKDSWTPSSHSFMCGMGIRKADAYNQSASKVVLVNFNINYSVAPYRYSLYEYNAGNTISYTVPSGDRANYTSASEYCVKITYDGSDPTTGWYYYSGWDVDNYQFMYTNPGTGVEIDTGDWVQLVIGSIDLSDDTSFCQYIDKIILYPGVGGTNIQGFDDDDYDNQTGLTYIVPMKELYDDDIDKIQISQYSDCVDSTSVIPTEIEATYVDAPKLVLDFTGDESYYTNTVGYYTDDIDKLGNITIEYGDTFDATDLSAGTLYTIVGGVEIDLGGAAAKCFRVTHELGRVSLAVVHATQMIVEQEHSRVNWGETGTKIVHNTGISPMGDYGEITTLRVFNNEISVRDAQVHVPDTDFGNHVQISTDGNTWVGKGEYITLSSIAAQSSALFYLRINVPEGENTPGAMEERLIFARWIS